MKTIQLVGGGTGGASDEGGGTRKKGARKGPRKTYKVGDSSPTVIKEGGGSTSPGTITQISASHIPGTPGAPEPVGVNSPLTAVGAPVQSAGKRVAEGKRAAATSPTASAVRAVSAVTAVTAVTAVPMKVVLAAAKKKKGKVILAAAKASGAMNAAKTRKVSQAKKVRVTISSMSKKIHKAKEIRKAASDTTLEDIKKALHKAGLIKGDSKAPEQMLRQMYADFMTLKGRAL